MKTIKKAIAVFFAILLISMEGLALYSAAANVNALSELVIDGAVPVQVKRYDGHTEECPAQVGVGKKLHLSVDSSETIKWESSNPDRAEVDSSGTVLGKNVGPVTIIALAEESGRTASVTLDITGKTSALKRSLEKKPLVSYKYSPVWDYYYTFDKDCWQQPFGFNFAYDMGSKILLLDYDYVRAFFTYEGKDWMIQMWKGQYGLLFFGDEIGVYTKPEGKSTATPYSHYASAAKSDYMYMQNELRHQAKKNGPYETVFVTPHDKFWWCTGFKSGHLRDLTSCKELRAISTIELKSEEMATLFVQALSDCGFKRYDDNDEDLTDYYFVDQENPRIVHLQWQNITEAQNKNPVQDMSAKAVASGGVVVIVFTAIFGLMFMLLFGWIGLIASAI